MISTQEAQARLNGYHETHESHDEAYTNGSKMGESVGVEVAINHHLQNNLPPPIQSIARQRHFLGCRVYSHHAGTELLPIHGSSSSWCSSLPWLNILPTADWGWRHWEPFHLLDHKPPLVVEWQMHMTTFLLDTKPLRHRGKWKSRPASKRHPWPWHRLLCRFEATCQPSYPAAGSTQWDVAVHDNDYYHLQQKRWSSQKFQHLTRADKVVITRLRIGHNSLPPSPTSFPDDPWIPVTIVTWHWPCTMCSWSVLCYRKVVTNSTQLPHWIPSSRQFLRPAEWNSCMKQDSSVWHETSDVVYNSLLKSSVEWCSFVNLKSSQTWAL